jgi:hypothetical protein
VAIKIMTAYAPSHWAGYLINRDRGELSVNDLYAADSWIVREGGGRPVSCEDAGFMRMHDAYREFPFATDCQEYVFLVPSDD